jgi:hypothetical protein
VEKVDRDLPSTMSAPGAALRRALALNRSSRDVLVVGLVAVLMASVGSTA